MAASPTAALDLPVAGLTVWLGYGKFYSLFSLLFGIGFSLQLAAADRRGDARLRVFRRRLLVLMAIGAVHLYFWEGDILFLYSIVGFLLIPFRRVSDTTLLRTAAALVLGSRHPRGADRCHAAARSIPGRRSFVREMRCSWPPASPAGALPYPVLRDAGWGEYLRFQLSGVFFRYARSAERPAGRSRCWRCFCSACGSDARACWPT